MNIYEKIFYNSLQKDQLQLEAIDRLIDFVKSERKDHRPFDNLFGNRNRILIKYDTSKEEADLRTMLTNAIKTNLPDFQNIDWKHKTVTRKITTQRGEKIQEIRLGTVLVKLKDKIPAKILDKYSKSKEKVIIVSRDPVDIVRMSDFKNLQSCHSLGGKNSSKENNIASGQSACALKEAVDGGVIAYLVYKDDLRERIFNESSKFQDSDIFNDLDRDITDKINPISRIRVRRFILENDPKFELGVLELIMYGEINGYFRELMKKFLTRTQQKQIKQLNEMDNPKLILTGGSYSDLKKGDFEAEFTKMGIKNATIKGSESSKWHWKETLYDRLLQGNFSDKAIDRYNDEKEAVATIGTELVPKIEDYLESIKNEYYIYTNMNVYSTDIFQIKYFMDRNKSFCIDIKELFLEDFDKFGDDRNDMFFNEVQKETKKVIKFVDDLNKFNEDLEKRYPGLTLEITIGNLRKQTTSSIIKEGAHCEYHITYGNSQVSATFQKFNEETKNTINNLIMLISYLDYDKIPFTVVDNEININGKRFDFNSNIETINKAIGKK